MGLNMFISTLKVVAQCFFETLVSTCKSGPKILYGTPISFSLIPLAPYFFYWNECYFCTHIYIIAYGEVTRD
jgi:hypothetical protein